MKNSVKFYLCAAIIAAAAIAGWHYSSTIDENKRLKQEAKQSHAIIEKERQQAQDAANRALALSIEESQNEKEYKRLSECVANKSCGYVLRFKSCPSMPGSASGESESSKASAELEREFQRWSNDHAYLIRQYETRVKALTEELKVRASPDYCQPSIR